MGLATIDAIRMPTFAEASSGGGHFSQGHALTQRPAARHALEVIGGNRPFTHNAGSFTEWYTSIPVHDWRCDVINRHWIDRAA